jgi:hypothetical protein
MISGKVRLEKKGGFMTEFHFMFGEKTLKFE